jgi:hypothetical protein
MTGREHKSVSIEPMRLGWIELQMPSPEHMGHRRGTQRKTRVAALGCFNTV